ncbi:tripartite motif-containing protein 16-like [Misgurnus anguillicaudatus]|uniref:tripartite motif-containing protein 16-like n=1 Tax=Misgurnus anguillicaudatus TaxID=75329 RepID=UPI003CCFB056
MFAELMEELNEMSLQPFRPAQRYSGPGDVECDVNRYNLMDPTRVNEMICPRHLQTLEVYCRTDQKCICYPCMMDEHRNHEIVTVAAERTEKQRHLRETQRNFQQRIQEREDELQDLKETVRSHQRSAQTAIKDNESFFNELIRSIKKTRSEVTRLIRDQEKTAVSQAEELLKQLEQEIDDLKRRDAELEQLSHTDDLIQFLQSFQSLSAAPESKVSHNIADSSRLSFVDEGKSFSELKEKIEVLCIEEIEKISDRVSNISIVRPNVPRTRKEFLQYSSQFTLDSNTVNHNLHLSDENRAATYTNTNQQYPDHPERFDYCPQVLCKESVTGRCYWEVEWNGSNGVLISMSYKTISRKNRENESLLGHNNLSCGVYCCPFSHSTIPIADFKAGTMSAEVYPNQYQAIAKNTDLTVGRSMGNPPVHSSQTKKVPVASSCPRIGVYVDHSAGTLSFYSVSDTMILIDRVQATFTQPLYPGFYVFKGSTVKLRHHTE